MAGSFTESLERQSKDKLYASQTLSSVPISAAAPPTFNDDVSLTSADSTMSNKVRIRSRPGILPTAPAAEETDLSPQLAEGGTATAAEMLLAFIDFIDIGEDCAACRYMPSGQC